MKKNQKPIEFNHGNQSILISPHDSTAWKMAMIFEYFLPSDELNVEELAKKYGYTREYFYQVLDKFKNVGSQALEDKHQGPKHNYKRTDEVKKQIIRLRFLDPEANSEVITQKMNQLNYQISQKSVERVISEYGLQKRGYIKQIRETQKQKLLKQKKPNDITPE